MAKLSAASGSSIIYSGSTYPVTNIKVSQKTDNTDVTDSSTATGYKESLDGRKETTFTFDGYKDGSVYDITTGVKYPAIVNIGGMKYIGTASIQDSDVDADVITGVVKTSYAGKFHGAVSQSLT